MDKIVLDKLVQETIDKHLSKVGCLFGEKSSYGDMLFNRYQHQAIHEQFTHMYERDTPLPSYHQFKVQECFPHRRPADSVSNLSRKLFISEEDKGEPDAVPAPDIVDFDRNYFDMQEKLEVFFGQIERIQKLLTSGNFDTAEKLYKSLKNKQDEAISFSKASELFLGERPVIPTFNS